ncbi:thioredoxin domain-containing protein [Porphyrobacter algicida]|uniref:Thioredoxin domain-containing protein n=1 Tax=Qipengyuania algicida TaxID=1836209 RepID=A0A845AH44_9SPHN|nr:thioredoxin domain-containing protein [Qipengyuania algicida]MXP28787.1 thioredoxin domain-containing protein [Qipengyuania algicida]
MPHRFRLVIAALLSLALVACGSKADTSSGAAPEGKPVAATPAPQGKQWRNVVQKTSFDGYLVGNPDAPIKLVEYGSLSCPVCARFGQEGYEPLMNNYVNTGKVSYELRNFAVHGPIDLVLARIVRCGSTEAVMPLSEQVWMDIPKLIEPLEENQAGYQAAMNQPMNQRFIAIAEAAKLFDFFAQRGISPAQAKQCLADVPAMEKLANDTQEQGDKFNINATPTFLINGQKLDNVTTWSALEPALQRAGAR